MENNKEARRAYEIVPISAGGRSVTFSPVALARLAEAMHKRALSAEAKLAAIKALVNAQAEDDGLWFQAQYITENYLQQELRRLHAVIEGKDE